uniref:non-specific lipid-transfer protein 1-like n=1 Tax=Erigeron canadensis TaxID=72917 RepID=UPI001CB9526A|nr:non-specific lipid-transfer protein 1-like [Erigeron canadensis]
MAGGSSMMVLVILVMAMNNASLLVNAISCQDAIARMLPCQAFLMGVGQISVPCCQSAQSLIKIANTNPQERTMVCQCLKQAATIVGINVARAQQIPQLCHIDLATSPINLNVDCNKLDTPTPQNSPQNEAEKMKPNKIWGPIIAPPPTRLPWDPIVIPTPAYSPQN